MLVKLTKTSQTKSKSTLTVEIMSRTPPCDVSASKERADTERWWGLVFMKACLLAPGIITATLAELEGNC